MQKQSARIWFKGKDHKDIYFQGNYHCAAYIGNELVWEKYLDGKWVFNAQVGTNIYIMKTLDPIKKEIKDQSITNAWNMTYNSERYIVCVPYSVGRYIQSLYISNTGGNRLNNFSDLITRDFNFAAALDDRILVCDSRVLYELRQNKEDKSYELLEVGELPSGFLEYIQGRCGVFLVGYYTDYEDSNKWKWVVFGEDNIFKEFAVLNRTYLHCCIQDSKKVYLLVHVSSNVYPYLDYPTIYIYDGKTTEIIHPDLEGKWTRDIAMIKRGKKFYIYERWLHGNGNYYIDIYTTEDFSSFERIRFEKCIVPFEDGFQVLEYTGTHTYHKVAFVADTNRVTVDDDTFKVQLPISSIRKQIPVYYESGEINHDREDLVLPFNINGFDSSSFLVAYLDNLYFEESDGNFGR